MKKILVVDDDPQILNAIRRQFRKEFVIETALGGAEGLLALARPDDYSVVMADMNMPGMNGVEFLSRVKIKAPNAVRVMLTGNADQHTAAEAVNEGSVFRFLTKPCSVERLGLALDAALHQHSLIVAEKEVLEQTFQGSIRILTEILTLVDPSTFGRTQLLKEAIQEVARTLGIEMTWELETAAMLSNIGYVTVPPAVVARFRLGDRLFPAEEQMLAQVPALGASFLANIPRLERVAQIVCSQHKHFDGSGLPEDGLAGEQIPPGARLLKVLLDLIDIEAKGTSRAVALEKLRHRQGWYDPKILDAAYACFAPQAQDSAADASVAVSLAELRVGQTLRSDVEAHDGALIVSKGSMITPPLLGRLLNLARLSGIKEPIYVESTEGYSSSQRAA